MSQKMKRVVALLMTAVLVGCLLGMTGCHRKEKAEDAATVVAVEEETKKGNLLSDLFGKDDEEKTSETSKSTSAKPTEKTTERADPNTTAAVTGTSKNDATEATTMSSGLFQVSQDYKNSHPYCVAVNTAQNIVIVYAKGADGNYTTPVKAMACSCGRAGHETPSGQYTAMTKQRWLYLIDGTYGQYCTKFREHYWFHSVPYYSQSPSDLEWPEYNKLGSNASAGCVRMCVRDVKWVYDNVSLGTVIRVYASSAAEPMAKPAPVRIDTSDSNPNRGWDPTDPDPGNPYV